MILPGPFHSKAVIQALTDLTKKDLSRMSKLESISADEVLETYEYFKA